LKFYFNTKKRAESAFDRAKSDLVREILTKHSMINTERFHMELTHDSSINAKY